MTAITQERGAGDPGQAGPQLASYFVAYASGAHEVTE
jgi:hypothetical protein